MAAPMATASSGLTDLLGCLPNTSCTVDCTFKGEKRFEFECNEKNRLVFKVNAQKYKMLSS
jgi:hypothetical protein